MDVDVDIPDDQDEGTDNTEILPMPVSGGIESLREKLHARMSQLRRGGGEADDKDDLFEERRRQRAAMRERRRKETRKIRREGETKGRSKDKEKEKQESEDKGNVTKSQLIVPDQRPNSKQYQGPQSTMATVSYFSLAGSSKKGQLF